MGKRCLILVRFPFLEGKKPGTSWRNTPAEPLKVSNRAKPHLAPWIRRCLLILAVKAELASLVLRASRGCQSRCGVEGGCRCCGERRFGWETPLSRQACEMTLGKLFHPGAVMEEVA